MLIVLTQLQLTLLGLCVAPTAEQSAVFRDPRALCILEDPDAVISLDVYKVTWELTYIILPFCSLGKHADWSYGDVSALMPFLDSYQTKAYEMSHLE